MFSFYGRCHGSIRVECGVRFYWAEDVNVSPFLVFLSPDGKTKGIVRTAACFPYHVIIASDGTVWTLGYEMINGSPRDAALDPQAGILRRC